MTPTVIRIRSGQRSAGHVEVRPKRRFAVILAVAVGVWICGALMGRAAAQSVVPGSAEKVCQVVGEFDRERGVPTVNQTESRFGLYGTDLGSSFEFENQLWVLFGDSIPTATFNGRDNLSFRDPNYNDSIAHSQTVDPSGCVRLQFNTRPNGAYASPVIHSRTTPVTLASFEVPLAGVESEDVMYVFFATGYDGKSFSTKSVVGVSSDGGLNFKYLYTFSNDKFVNIQTATTGENRDSDDSSDLYGKERFHGSPFYGRTLWIWGTKGGAGYRHSNPYLAVERFSALRTGSGTLYYAGDDPSTHRPVFSDKESDAAELFADNPACMGELSVSRNRYLRRWLMLYYCMATNVVVMRSAPNPWGPWTASQTIFDPSGDGGYCHFIHVPNCDSVNDPGRENVPGGPYGGYVVNRLTTGNSRGTTIYYLLSTWNPYTVVLMRSEIRSK